jgi:hypothetical protein
VNYENEKVRFHVLETVNMKIAVFWCESRAVWYKTTKFSEKLAASIFRIQGDAVLEE